ncbi:MAG: hypothetical protein COZ06_10015 [Armatimonadetes bacterium CG_4_10_14_3_um_filter_66_18]|nr:sugar ABC transporter permease [Armatimonadota bacterium]OIO98313.1 MAG: hypothetical protein AUJ96_21490 [Armatimonadetes bacterium CG2_30_66_41]PIU90235.1 MAG: hypothetical protein COS65_26080 [Armatimonadetes bacterium CG06_land_8_20_14_3_00_66_21]PIX46022.1 MAG: hypothetical protein COZ57_13585 [Armatimonadetes bacterium CG_4_8_14_3_um_filter_66_20]PIY50340.1 MAG: hypothetical protein COZ06_10015 [Armatimonadetes bacterium CG_4_10_14_3_um_filter_66_18]PIZ43145.1 MAG: hypothetical protei
MQPRTLKSLKEHLSAYAFLAPALLILGAFGVFPLLYAFYVSVHRWRFKKGDVVGAANFVKALGEPALVGRMLLGFALLGVAYWLWERAARSDATARAGLRVVWAAALLGAGCFLILGLPGAVRTGDLDFYNGLKITVFYAAFSIPLQLSIALLLAFALFNLGTKVGLLRLIYFLPYITPMIASAVVFRSLFSPQEHSIANRVLTAFGSKPLGWLFENDSIARVLLQGIFHVKGPDWVDAAFPSLALISVILYNTWVYVGYNTVIFLAGLSTVPKELYEAASLDGAGSWSVLRNVTIPLLSPTIFFLSMMSVIGTFKAFNHIYLMRTAGAQGTLDSSSIVIFDEFFKAHNAGYASAMALCLFAVILTLTVLQNRLVGKRVFYG